MLHNIQLIVATHNADKLCEIRAILQDLPIMICSQAEAGWDGDVEETGDSFPANALIKARAIHEAFPEAYVLADDSGLCVDALGGAPGIYSARFADTETDYPKKFRRLWTMLSSVDPGDWTARYICAMAVVRPDGSDFVTVGQMPGRLIDRPAGKHGFGYDPIFYLDEAGMTAAQLEPDVKNRCSHRYFALCKVQNRLACELPVVI